MRLAMGLRILGWPGRAKSGEPTREMARRAMVKVRWSTKS